MSTEKMGASGRTVQSVDRAVTILERLAATEAGMSLTELARSLSLPPQTAQSLLRTLQRRRWVSQSARRGRYRLGPGLGEIHRRWRAGQDRIALAKPVMVDLGARLGEYVILAEWTGNGLMALLELQPNRELAVRGQLYLPERIHTMATGKLLLAYLDETRRREIVAALPLPHRGPNSATNGRTLLRQLKSIRRDGVAVCEEETAAGVVAVAAPVSTDAGPVTVAVGVALPLARYSPARRDELIAALRDAGEAVAEAWG